MKILVLYNSSSGLGEAAIFDYVRNFVQNGDEVVLRVSDGQTDMRTFLHDADSYDVVVISGGDGTASSIVYTLADTGIPVLPFPGGTANLLALNLESPNEPHALVAMTREMRVMDFDIGVIKFPDGSKHGFTLMAGAGFDATIMQGAEVNKRIFGSVAYFTSALANAIPQHSDITLGIDGQEILTSGVGVLVMNFSRIQFDLTLIHDNMPRDGVFDVVVLQTQDAFGLLPALFDALLDRAGDHPFRSDALQVFQGRDIRVEANPPLPVQYDGEVLGKTTPFSISMLEGAARFVISEQCEKIYATENSEED